MAIGISLSNHIDFELLALGGRSREELLLGRLEAGVDEPPTETVVWDVYSTHAYPNGVFTPEEALVVFAEYMATGTLGPDWSLRLLPVC